MLVFKKLITLACLFSLSLNTAQSKTSPLLEQVYKLQCAKDQSTAKLELEKLRALSILPLGLPTEKQNNQADNHLTAGSLDITLNTLLNTAEKYPALQNRVERTLLRWNYCRVFENKKFYDLFENQPRHHALYKPPLNWIGFKRLGFLDSPATFIPKLLSQSALGDRAFEMFFHRIYRQQCFPHHITGKLYHQLHRVSSQRIVHNQTHKKEDYPYAWQEACASTQKIKTTSPVKEIKKEKPKQYKTTKKIKETKPIKKIVLIEKTKKKHLPVVVEKIAKTPPLMTYLEPKEKPKSPKKKEKLKIKEIPEKPKAIAHLPNKKRPIINILTPPSTGTNAPIPTVISENPEDTHGLTGNIYIKQGLSGDHPTIGGTTSWKPIADSYWFVRGSIDYDYQIESPLTYSWGAGYDDWHAGTWSAQINNWGPITPGEGLALDLATVNIGYKIKSETLAKYNLHANTSVDIPIKGDPALNLGLQWNPKENWYIRANINQPSNGAERTWSYGFGYSDWRVNKINVEYANYGANELFDTNFREGGVVSVSYNWEF